MTTANNNNFSSLAAILEGWFEKPLIDLPEELRQRVKYEFLPLCWDDLAPDQRRSFSLQWDYQHDPSAEQERAFWFDFWGEKSAIEKQIGEWKTVDTPTAGDLAQKETRLVELEKTLARMDQRVQQEQKKYRSEPYRAHMDQKQSQTSPTSFIPYPKALKSLSDRLTATPEELAAWVWMGPKHGGLAAYKNANELAPPPRFHYDDGFGDNGDNFDYLRPLMACWFGADDIASFQPADRFITGKTLIERWKALPGIHAEAFIRAKIAESRLNDLHPIYGGTQGTSPNDEAFPPLESALFVLSEVEAIENEDFGTTISSEIATPLFRLKLNQQSETTPAQFKQRHLLQEEEILNWLATNGHDPKNLPLQENGKPGLKADAWKELKQNRTLFLTKNIFNKAWQRARNNGDIQDKK